jgi:transposase
MKRDTWLKIKDYCSKGRSKRWVARHLGVSRSTVARALLAEHPPRRSGGRHGSALDGHMGWMQALLESEPGITAARIHAMLVERGVKAGTSTIREHVARLRPKATKAYLTLHFQPGECAQVDWGRAGVVEIEGTRRNLSLFVMVLAHSRMLYAELCLSEKMECWLAAHCRAFEYFGGVPQKVMHDNLKTAVIRHDAGTNPVFNPRYLDLARHYGFEPVACTPYRPNQKGRVENGVGYIRRAFLCGRPLEHPPALGEAMRHWLDTVANVRIHGTTHERPVDRFRNEQAKLLQLPLPYDCCTILPCQANSQFRVIVDTNRYSVPPKYASRKLELRLYEDRVILYDGPRLVAEHVRSYARRKDRLTPAHEREILERNRHGRRQRQLSKFLDLCEESSRYLEELKQRRPDWSTHIARINALVGIYGEDATIRVLRDATDNNAFSADYIHSMLCMSAKSKPEAGPLHVTRGEDLLKLKSIKVDLDLYNPGKDPWK